METLEEEVARVLKEEAAVGPYDPRRPEMFERERLHLTAKRFYAKAPSGSREVGRHEPK